MSSTCVGGSLDCKHLLIGAPLLLSHPLSPQHLETKPSKEHVSFGNCKPTAVTQRTANHRRPTFLLPCMLRGACITPLFSRTPPPPTHTSAFIQCQDRGSSICPIFVLSSQEERAAEGKKKKKTLWCSCLQRFG